MVGEVQELAIMVAGSLDVCATHPPTHLPSHPHTHTHTHTHTPALLELHHARGADEYKARGCAEQLRGELLVRSDRRRGHLRAQSTA